MDVVVYVVYCEMDVVLWWEDLMSPLAGRMTISLNEWAGISFVIYGLCKLQYSQPYRIS